MDVDLDMASPLPCFECIPFNGKEMEDPVHTSVKHLLRQSLSSSPNELKAAQDGLASAEKHPGFVKCLLQVTQHTAASSIPSATDVDSTLSLAAAIYFKNFIRANWNQPTQQGPLLSDDRTAVKQNLLSLLLMTRASKAIQAQLAEALAMIAEVEFPLEWPTLLPEIVARLSAIKSTGLSGISEEGEVLAVASLEVVHTLLKKYRNIARSNEVLLELKTILTEFQKPFLECYVFFQQGLSENSICSEKSIVNYLRIVYLCTKIFYSLNVIDLPEFFEDHMHAWFGSFFQLLDKKGNLARGISQSSLLRNEAIELIECIEKQICENLKLYSDKYQEEFTPYVLQSIHSVWELLKVLNEQSQNDMLVCAAIDFLASAAQTRWDITSEDKEGIRNTPHIPTNPFSDPEVLHQLCTKLIVPSVHLRDSDIALMEENPQEFLRKDFEGGDQHMRRTSALDLVKSLAKFHDEQITNILLQCVSELSSQYSHATGMTCERLKESCTYLMIALAVRGASRLKGVLVVNTKVDIYQFYEAYLASELVDEQVDNRVICRCAAMRYITTFRNQFPKELLQSTLMLIGKHLKAQNPIIHSNAAYCIEKVLTIRKDGHYLLDKIVVKPVLISALDPLLKIVSTNQGIPDNEHVMKCILRVLVFLSDQGSNVAVPVLKQLLEIIKEKSNNPSNPIFNHYLFETVGSIVKIAAPKQLNEVEHYLVPVFSTIIQRSMHDFTPYCFQIMGLLLDLSTSGADMYANLFDHLMDISFWSISQANVPGLERFLSAYFRKSHLFSAVIEKNIQSLFERFQYCLYHKKLNSVAFDLLNGVFRYLSFPIYSKYFETLITMLLVRVQELNRKPSFCSNLVTSLSLFVCQQESASTLPDVLNKIQSGLVVDFFSFIFLPNATSIRDIHSRKVVVLALSKLCTIPLIHSNSVLLEKVLKTISQLITGENDLQELRRRPQLDDVEEDYENFGMNAVDREHFDVAYAKLGSAQVVSKDWLEGIADLHTGIRACLSSVPVVRDILSKEVNEFLPIVQLLG
ncbi:importin-beta N-terminal domain-containing protein [Cardiosporidium cionae]|uniref:Importin-beta N-terminal domain-containing protein n=1 Tax=Cardiosporidium cionae TaxID=476202 RepID=A0ABQ7JF68_9APIC|nr:importin-beta N-terminal domain-containing protein [Cardiosporidium cionae]|eukprot:KAF8822295.1 importin-beta N-terminal domain-containing protein [Cardiosporidium cionae]